MPARIICSKTSGDSEAGPIVQTIFVLLAGNDVMGIFLPKEFHGSILYPFTSAGMIMDVPLASRIESSHCVLDDR
jgi:hypothetical protein